MQQRKDFGAQAVLFLSCIMSPSGPVGDTRQKLLVVKGERSGKGLNFIAEHHADCEINFGRIQTERKRAINDANKMYNLQLN